MTNEVMPVIDRDSMEKLVSRILQLPEKKMKRVLELGRLFRDSFDDEEKMEIATVLAEIIQPELCDIKWPAGATVNIDDTVSESAARKVESYRKSVGRKIRTLRKQAGMTQEDLAEASGLPQSHICRLELGQHAATEETIIRIAKPLKVEPGEIDPAF